MQPKILIGTTTWWAMPARLALAFESCDAQVYSILPHGSPLHAVKSVQGFFPYRATRPLSSLAEAIEAIRPDQIVPCDDRVVAHLHSLYEEDKFKSAKAHTAELIETSLGAASGYPIARSRGKLLKLADELGIRTPETAIVTTWDELRLWFSDHGFPAVLKVDGTWGGSGVQIVRCLREAAQAYTQLKQRRSAASILRQLCFHDLYPLFSGSVGTAPEITVQSYIGGRPANAMFACSRGNVLGCLSVDVLYSPEELGAATVVRTGPDAEMESAGQALIKALGMSGFCGLDFIKEKHTGRTYLIELNPRATQLGHLKPGGRSSLVEALVANLKGEHLNGDGVCARESIAFFPRAAEDTPGYPVLADRDLVDDVPWNAPELVRELNRLPWNRRHLSAFAYIAFQKLMNRRADKSGNA